MMAAIDSERPLLLVLDATTNTTTTTTDAAATTDSANVNVIVLLFFRIEGHVAPGCDVRRMASLEAKHAVRASAKQMSSLEATYRMPRPTLLSFSHVHLRVFKITAR